METQDFDLTHCQIMCSQKIVLQNRIGRGCQGSVYIGYDLQSKQRYAIKVMNIGTMDQKQKQRLACQIQSNFTLSHVCEYKYFPYFHGYWLKDSQIFLAFQLCEGNALEGIKKSHSHAASYSFAYILLYDILKGLQLLQQRNIIHRDLKPQNMLLDKGSFKICDLGLSKIAQKGKKLTIDVGNLMSRSPESYSQSYDCRTDIWSLGVNVFWIAFGTLPFDEQIIQLLNENKISEIKERISNQNFRVCLGPVQTYLLVILTDMLEINPIQRLNAEELLDKYFNQTIQNFPTNFSIENQIQHTFFLYLKMRDNKISSGFILMIILLLIDYEKARQYENIHKILDNKAEKNKRQICRRVRINIFLILKFCLYHHSAEIQEPVSKIMEYYLNKWQLQLSSMEENKIKISKQLKKIQDGLKMHQIEAIRERFPLVNQAVKVYHSIAQQKEIYLWDILQFDLRLHKI